MLNSETAAEVERVLADVSEVEVMVRSIAQYICAEQPDMPDPRTLRDLDSFSMVQVLLELENYTGRKFLEKFEGFSEGETFRDLAEFIVLIVSDENGAEAERAV